jgi:hypothetical protein
VTLVDRYDDLNRPGLVELGYWLGFIIGGADLNAAVFPNRSRRDSLMK